MKLVSSRSGNFIAAPYSVDGVEAGVPFEVSEANGKALIAKYGSLFSEAKAKAAAPPVTKMRQVPKNKGR